MRLIAIKEKQQLVLFAAILGISTFFVGAVLFLGLGGRLHQLNVKIAAVEEKLRNLYQIYDRRDIISEEYHKYAAYLEASALTVEKGREVILKEVEELVRISGMSLISLLPQEAKSSQKEVAVDLRTEGNWGQVVNFLSCLANSKLLLKPKRISILPKDEQASLLKVDITIVLGLSTRS